MSKHGQVCTLPFDTAMAAWSHNSCTYAAIMSPRNRCKPSETIGFSSFLPHDPLYGSVSQRSPHKALCVAHESLPIQPPEHHWSRRLLSSLPCPACSCLHAFWCHTFSHGWPFRPTSAISACHNWTLRIQDVCLAWGECPVSSVFKSPNIKLCFVNCIYKMRLSYTYARI